MNRPHRHNRAVCVGKVVGVHGLKGAVKVYSYAESTQVFHKGLAVACRDGDSAARILTIAWAKPGNRVMRIAFEEIENRDQAEAIVGTQIEINRHRLPEPEPDTYYWADLMGMTVTSVTGERLGRLVHIIATGSNDVYVVEDGGNEILIPALTSVVQQVDLDAGTMLVDLPEGLV